MKKFPKDLYVVLVKDGSENFHMIVDGINADGVKAGVPVALYKLVKSGTVIEGKREFVGDLAK